jgi:hypothetical protein
MAWGKLKQQLERLLYVDELWFWTWRDRVSSGRFSKKLSRVNFY